MNKILEAIYRMLHRMHRDKRGFTLIELIIVIAIIAIIAGIAIPRVTARIHEAKVAADKANVRVLQGAVDLYYLEKGNYDGLTKQGSNELDTAKLVSEGYLQEDIEHPFDGEHYELVDGKVTSSAQDEW